MANIFYTYLRAIFHVWMVVEIGLFLSCWALVHIGLRGFEGAGRVFPMLRNQKVSSAELSDKERRLLLISRRLMIAFLVLFAAMIIFGVTITAMAN